MERGVIQGNVQAPLAFFKMPHRGTFKGCIHLLHGMGEHKERYLPLADYLSSLGYTVYAHDHRGHGASLKPGQAVGVWESSDSFALMIDDVRMVQDYILEKEACQTLTLIGHSMGSIIARGYLYTQQPPTVDRVLLLGTMPLSSRWVSAVQAGLISLLSKSTRKNAAKRKVLVWQIMNQALKTKRNRDHFNWLSYNEDNVSAYTSDPLSGYPYNGRFYREFFKTIHQLNRPDAWNLTQYPTFLMSGSDDPVSVSEAALQKTLATVLKNRPDWRVRLVMIADAEHEWFREKNPNYAWFKEVLNDAL